MKNSISAALLLQLCSGDVFFVVERLKRGYVAFFIIRMGGLHIHTNLDKGLFPSNL